MEIKINGCVDCPLCNRNDFCPGYTCEADTKEIILEDNKKFIPITPDWCPAKKEPIIIKSEYNSKT